MNFHPFISEAQIFADKNRGNWRKESTSAPSLLAKSCHDMDILLWLLTSPPPGSSKPAHLPSSVSSSGALQYFHQGRKPIQAGNATNCRKNTIGSQFESGFVSQEFHPSSPKPITSPNTILAFYLFPNYNKD